MPGGWGGGTPTPRNWRSTSRGFGVPQPQPPNRASAINRPVLRYAVAMPSSATQTAKRFMVAQLDQVPGVPCPCGTSRRAFAVPKNQVATIHLVDAKTDTALHYHKKLTETYL